MFGKLRDPGGGYTLLMSGVACFGLAGWLLLSFREGVLLALPVTAALAGSGCVVVWWRRRQEAKYDLRRLFDAPPPSRSGSRQEAGEEPYEDHIPGGEVSAPYCGWCDESFPPGTYRCRQCGRELG